MAELWFSADANAQLTTLETADDRPQLLEAVNTILDQLADDPGHAAVRRHLFAVGLWCVFAHGDGEEWVVLWEPYRVQPADGFVKYVGPASFA